MPRGQVSAPMSPPPPEIEVEFSVEDGVSGEWDTPRIGELTRTIVAGEATEGTLATSRRPASVSQGHSSLTGLIPGDVAARRESHAPRYLIALHLVSDDSIQALNAEHRAIDARTDVLSFPIHGDGFVTPPGEPVNLGDVVVSYPRAVEQAAEYGHSVDRELAYLVAHGVLHILGYDHEIDADKGIMRQREEAALEPLGYTRPA